MDSPQTPMKDPHRAGIAADSTVRGTAIPIDSAPEPLRKRSSGTAWIPWVIAAALAIAVAGLGMKVRTLNHALRTQGSAVGRATEENVHSQRVLNLLRAPSAQHITLTKEPSGDPAGHAVYLADRGELIFQADHLKSLPEGKTYQLWLIPTDGRAPIPAGLFRPGKGGDASIVMPPLPVGVAAVAFGITIENAQGGKHSDAATGSFRNFRLRGGVRGFFRMFRAAAAIRDRTRTGNARLSRLESEEGFG